MRRRRGNEGTVEHHRDDLQLRPKRAHVKVGAPSKATYHFLPNRE